MSEGVRHRRCLMREFVAAAGEMIIHAAPLLKPSPTPALSNNGLGYSRSTNGICFHTWIKGQSICPG
jgi:hypothetical protein